MPAAAAAWTASGGGTSAAGAAVAPRGPMPTAVATGVGTIAVSWSAATMAGAPVAGYRIRRYATVGGAESAVGGACAGTVAATSCTETGVPFGSWRYSVTPVHQSWTGSEGSLSISITLTL